MSWNGWSDFISMRGYGLYVWGSYALTALAMAIEPVLVRRRRQRALAQAGDRSGEGEA